MSKTTKNKLTREQYVEIACDHCGKMMRTKVYPIININEVPKLRSKIMDASLFIQKCPSCGKDVMFPYSTIYSDDRNGLIISMACDEKEYADALALNKSTDMYGNMMRQINANGELRLVRTPLELAEKVCVRESHYDDRIMELMKFHLLLKMREQGNPAVAMYYIVKNRKEELAVLLANGSAGSIAFQDAWYQEAAAAYSSAVRNMKEHPIVVDGKWASSFLRPVEIMEEGEGVSID